MADNFQGGEDLYKSGRQEQDPKHLAEIVKQYLEIIKANKELEALTLKQTKSLAAQEKNYERLEKRLTSLRTKAIDPVVKAIDSLTTKFTGSSGINQAITKFTGATTDSIFQVDKINDKVSFFGRTLDISATTALRYTAAIQLIIAATLKYLEFQDKAQKQQGVLMKSFAQTDISISGTYDRAAQGWRVAGSTGKDAAKTLDTVISKARMTGAKEFFKGIDTTELAKATDEYNKLLYLTSTFSDKVPEFITRLSESFAVRSQTTVVDQLEQLAILATKSGAPVDQLGEMIFSLGENFAYLGMQVKDSQEMVAEFADAVGKKGMPAAVGMAIASQFASEFQTAAGVPNVGKTAWMVSQQFSKLPEPLQKLVGGQQFLEKDIYQQMEQLYKLSPAEYTTLKATAGYQQMKEIERTQGTVAARAATPELTAVEARTLQEYFEKATPGITTKEETAKAYEDLIKKMQDQIERTGVTSADVRDAIDKEREELSSRLSTIAERLQEWHSGISAAWEDVKGTFAGKQEGVRRDTKLSTLKNFSLAISESLDNLTRFDNDQEVEAEFERRFPPKLPSKITKPKKSTTVETEGNDVITSDGKRIKVTNIITYDPQASAPTGKVSRSQMHQPNKE
jgi:hypothetical protein